MNDGNNVDSKKAAFECPVYTTLSVISGKWKLLIIYDLFQKVYRFNELKRAVPGISQRLLTAQLRELESCGVVARDVKDVVPPHVEYRLTPRGRTLWPILEAMEKWGMDEKEGGNQ